VGPEVLGIRLDWVPAAAGPVWAVLLVVMAASAAGVYKARRTRRCT
jgi:tryptophan-rich sensory protein